MDLKLDYKLRPDQRPCPVVLMKQITLPVSAPFPTDQVLQVVFRTAAFNLQTWGRTTGRNGRTILTDDPHWICVRGGTTLHVDPKYPRYSHHLKMRVDPQISVRGKNKVEHVLIRGTFYILDTHSPHQVLARDKTRNWNFATSLDAHEPRDADETIAKLLRFAIASPILVQDGVGTWMPWPGRDLRKEPA